MVKNIIVKELNQTPIEDLEIEIVERKGIGHPDSISDGIAESVSRALCNLYIDEFGFVLHHNTDEVQITAGESNPKFGGGSVIKPIDFLLTGRGTAEYEGKKLPLDVVAIEAAKNFLKENIINLNPETDAVVECKIGHGSGDLVDVFDRDERKTNVIPKSNDTSFGVSYAPYSETENIVLKTEELLNSRAFKKRYPGVGEDIKVMGLRNKDKITLTVGAAFVSQHIADIAEYKEVRQAVLNEVSDLATKESDRELEVYVNTADEDTSKDESGYYLTVTGTSAEMGDDGSVGRGNRANGLITPNRPMSMEATSGKNPINHVGKIYNILSYEIAHDVAKNVDGVKQINMMILSQIGQPIDNPIAASSQIIVEDGYKFDEVSKKVESAIDSWLDDLNNNIILDKVISGKARTF
ncbi:methionine adenosyltransferase [Methanobrevibacter curvatus]|uniref:S-adenosylmethionine synthase n=1 Tax=Methanobrevibacter curvatus TaxID=49547 RepID=A0A166A5M2_9EURY|nr:methionine adenosyltransferase [Methanobrevibacter curvatus]KZX11603.1 S-adenosylmethionine synthase [Methanobrevibacter curvatus]